MLGFLQDDWNSIAATIDYATDLGSTFAQFKMLTPYPGTPMFKQLEPLLTETDWEKFDGYTPTFTHPNLTDRELRFLLGAAYKRFYMRPSYLANFLKIQNTAVRDWVSRMDRRVNDRHTREEIADFSRPWRAEQRTAYADGDCEIVATPSSPYRSCSHRCRHADAPSRATERESSRTPNRSSRRCKARGEFIQGPQIAEFERAFERRAGGGTRDRRRLRPHGLLLHPEGARPSGRIRDHLSVADLLGRPRARARRGSDRRLRRRRSEDLQPRSRVGRADDHATRRARLCRRICTACRATWTALLEIAARHNLVVLEDCAHALGATYKGRPVGTFGTGALFSFQTLKPLNCYGGGLALVQRSRRSPRKCARIVDALPWPSEKRVRDRLLMGRLQRIFIKPWVFSISLFPVLWVSALIDANPDVFLWEKIRSLHPLPGPVHGTLPQRAGGVRARRARAPGRLDRAGAGATRAT